MTTELAQTPVNPDLATAPFTWATLSAVVDTEMVPKAVRGKPAAALAMVLMGREMGIGPMTSLRMLDFVDGSPSLSAELQTAMIRQAGHSLLADEVTAQEVTVTGTRSDNGDSMTVTFNMDMAARAGLATKSNWMKYPEAMMWARAVSMLARMLYADVFTATHVYTADELGDEIEIPDIVEVDNVGTVSPGRAGMDRPHVQVSERNAGTDEGAPDRPDAV